MLFGEVDVSFLGYRWHPEVWLVVAGVIFLGVYVARVIAPKVPVSQLDGGPAITRRQKGWFWFGVFLLWAAADWPLHDIAEEYLYSLHMFQHIVLSLVMPPVFLLAMPRWLVRLVIPESSKVWAVLRRIGRPVPAAVIFNTVVLITHWPLLVNLSVEIGPVHYLVHLVIVASSVLMWIPVCGPWKELRLGAPATCIYLFMQSIIPTVPGAWLALAEHAVYEAYDHGPRMWGISVTLDQQYAGLLMKLGEAGFLWGLIIAIFFRWALGQEHDRSNRRVVRLEDGLDYVAPAPAPAPAPEARAAEPQQVS